MPFLPRPRLLPRHLAIGLSLLAGLATGCTPEAVPGSGPNRPFVTDPTVDPTPAPSPGSQLSVSFQTQVVPLLQDRCSACHAGTGSGGVSLFDGSGSPRYSNIKNRIASILAEVRSGGMPLGGPRLTQSEVQLLESWREDGALDN